MPRAKQRTPALHDRLVLVATEVLATEGVARFTTRRVAQGAQTSPAAVYELFGDKAGLVRDVFFEGFRLLRGALEKVTESSDPRADLVQTVKTIRGFVRKNEVLADVMFSRPFADFEPGPAEQEAGSGVREHVIGTVRRNVEAGVLAGDPTDIAHAVLALTLGLAAAERAGRLGTSAASVNRRWTSAIDALLAGFGPS